MANEKKIPEQEAHDSGIVDPGKDELVEKHSRENPEGDPAVRRVNPDRGEIPIEEEIAPGIMRVTPPEKAQKKKKPA